MRRQFSGTFLTQALGAGSWRLSRADPSPIDIYLRGADSAAAVLRAAEVSDLAIEWRPGSVILTAGVHSTGVHSAIVHEPVPHLHDDLPLGRFDARAARFWRRVFWLIRIPGGRRLIGAWTRRSRGGNRLGEVVHKNRRPAPNDSENT